MSKIEFAIRKDIFLPPHHQIIYDNHAIAKSLFQHNFKTHIFHNIRYFCIRPELGRFLLSFSFYNVFFSHSIFHAFFGSVSEGLDLFSHSCANEFIRSDAFIPICMKPSHHRDTIIPFCMKVSHCWDLLTQSCMKVSKYKNSFMQFCEKEFHRSNAFIPNCKKKFYRVLVCASMQEEREAFDMAIYYKLRRIL